MNLSSSLFSKDWFKLLEPEFSKPYFIELKSFLDEQYSSSKIIYPESENIFNAFKSTSYRKTRVVILGQDPYHGENQAHGLSFSVQKGIKVPPSLKNIFKELEAENIGFTGPRHGNLQKWADQGVLLLNNVLTVEASKAGSHQKKGWEKFTERVIQILAEKKSPIVFMLWGKPAQKKCQLINQTHHHILESVHPSPLSAYRGFFGCQHFKMCNQILKDEGLKEINWNL